MLSALPYYLITRRALASALALFALAALALAVAPTTPQLIFDAQEVRTNTLFGLLAAGAALPGLRSSLGPAEEASRAIRRLRLLHVGIATAAVATCCLPFAARSGGGAGLIAVTNAMCFLGLMLITAALHAPLPDWMVPTLLAGVTYMFGTLGGEGPLWWAFLFQDAGDPVRLSLTLGLWLLGATMFVCLRRPPTSAD